MRIETARTYPTSRQHAYQTLTNPTIWPKLLLDVAAPTQLLICAGDHIEIHYLNRTHNTQGHAHLDETRPGCYLHATATLPRYGTITLEAFFNDITHNTFELRLIATTNEPHPDTQHGDPIRRTLTTALDTIQHTLDQTTGPGK